MQGDETVEGEILKILKILKNRLKPKGKEIKFLQERQTYRVK